MFDSLVRRRWLVLALMGLVSWACASPKAAQAAPSSKLYFALEVRRDGKLVGKPKLLSETGRVARLLRQPLNAPQPDLFLELLPTALGTNASEGYQVELDVRVPDAKGRAELALQHGQELTLELGPAPGDLAVKLLLMRVDSPEFRALMAMPTESAPGTI